MTELEVLIKKRKANEKSSQRLWEELQEWYHWRTSFELDELSDRWHELNEKIKILKGSKNG